MRALPGQLFRYPMKIADNIAFPAGRSLLSIHQRILRCRRFTHLLLLPLTNGKHRRMMRSWARYLHGE